MAKHGKKYLEARRRIDREHEYSPAEAVKLVKESKFSKFDESVEVHIRTGLNVRHADEQLRGTVALPHGLGRDVTIDRKSTRLNSSHANISYAVFCLKKNK